MQAPLGTLSPSAPHLVGLSLLVLHPEYIESSPVVCCSREFSAPGLLVLRGLRQEWCRQQGIRFWEGQTLAELQRLRHYHSWLDGQYVNQQHRRSRQVAYWAFVQNHELHQLQQDPGIATFYQRIHDIGRAYDYDTNQRPYTYPISNVGSSGLSFSQSSSTPGYSRRRRSFTQDGDPPSSSSGGPSIIEEASSSHERNLQAWQGGPAR